MRGASFLGVQLSSGVIALPVWALLSQLSTDGVALLAPVLAIGLVVFLPTTLGLPFVLPNFYRADRISLPEARSALTMTAAASVSISILGGLSLWFFPEPAFIGLGLIFAGLVATSVALQQVARINEHLRTFAVGSAYNLVLPGLGASAAVIGLPLPWAVAAGLSIWNAVGVALLMLARPPSDASEGSLKRHLRVLRLAAPLIPHLFAFAVLMQGLRIVVLTRPGEISVAVAHTLMLFVGLAFAVVNGVNALLTVQVQKVGASGLDATRRRVLMQFLVLGAAGAIAMPLAYASPIRSYFRGSETLSLSGYLCLSAVPPLLCSYYFLSAHLLRAGNSAQLSRISLTAASAFGLGTLVAPADVSVDLSMFTLSFCILVIGSASVARRGGEPVRLRLPACIAVPALPGIVAAAATLFGT